MGKSRDLMSKAGRQTYIGDPEALGSHLRRSFGSILTFALARRTAFMRRTRNLQKLAWGGLVTPTRSLSECAV